MQLLTFTPFHGLTMNLNKDCDLKGSMSLLYGLVNIY